MKETLKVRNFSVLKDVEIELKPINLVIGPQASGKSLLAKLLHLCRQYLTGMIAPIQDGASLESYNVGFQKRFQELFPCKYWGDGAFQIRYQIDSVQEGISGLHFERIPETREMEVKATGLYDSVYREMAVAYSNSSELDSDDWPHAADAHLLSTAGWHGKPSSSLIPAGRSFFAQVDRNPFRFGEDLSPEIKEFAKELYGLRNRYSASAPRIDETVLRIAKRLLSGEYARIDQRDHIRHDSGLAIELAFCSSAQQEIQPLYLFLLMLMEVDALDFMTRLSRSRSILIEEPEAHLFPTAQRDLVNLFTHVFNRCEGLAQFFITTHSPYILTSFNNLLLAGSVSRGLEGEKLKKLEAILPRTFWIRPGDVAAYVLEDGTCKSLIDEETELVSADAIDDVSGELAREFNRILELSDGN